MYCNKNLYPVEEFYVALTLAISTLEDVKIVSLVKVRSRLLVRLIIQK